MLGPDKLKELRKEISGDADVFLNIVNEDSFRSHFGGLSDEGKLKRVPLGFEKDDPMAEYLKMKHFVATREITDQTLLDADAPRKLAAIYQSLKPLIDFLNAPVF